MRQLRVRSLIALALGIAIFCVLCNTPLHSMETRYSGLWFYIPAPLIQLPTFAAGVVLGNIFLLSYRHSSRSRLRRLPIYETSVRSRFPVLTLLGVISSLAVLLTCHGRWEGLTIPAFSFLLFGLAAERTVLSRFLSTRALILGGEISYALYLLRPPVQWWILTNPVLHKSRLIDLLYIPAVVIPFSFLCFRFIETPSRRAIQRLFASWQTARS